MKELTFSEAIRLKEKLNISLDLVAFLYLKANNRAYYRELEASERAILEMKNLYDIKKKKFLTPFMKLVREQLALKKDVVPIIHPKMETIINKMSSLLILEDPILPTFEQNLKKHLNANEQAMKLYLLWYYLWPTKPGSKKNEKWDTFFGIKYNNVKLRSSEESKIKWFSDMLKKPEIDHSALILASYLFLKNYIKPDGSHFIPGQIKFMDSWISYYEEALEHISSMSPAEIWNLFIPVTYMASKGAFEKPKEGVIITGFRRG